MKSDIIAYPLIFKTTFCKYLKVFNKYIKEKNFLKANNKSSKF
jgi:hypothetical protein